MNKDDEKIVFITPEPIEEYDYIEVYSECEGEDGEPTHLKHKIGEDNEQK